MTIWEYLKGQKNWMMGVAGIFIVNNLILLTSTPLNKSLGEIFYMDLLMLVIVSLTATLHYMKMKKRYGEIKAAILEKKEVSELFEKELDVLGLPLMKQLSAYKDSTFRDKEADYQQRMNDLKDYITQTVHDLKVNLAVCEMVTERIAEHEDEKEKLVFQIKQMGFRINQALYITRANHYYEDIISENVDVQQIVKEAIHDNAEFFMSKDASIQVDLKPYQLISDAKWIHYIVTQILNNSSKYIDYEGEVTVYSSEDEKGYYLHIKDNGMGITEEEQNRVFDKGFTGKNGRTNTKSTGMGMYYAKKMAAELGIGLTLKSQQGVYTEFILSFYKLSDYMQQMM